MLIDAVAGLYSPATVGGVANIGSALDAEARVGRWHELPSGRPPRSPALTGLRGIGCVLIVLGNLWTIVPAETLERTGPLEGLFRSGRLGVIVLMVLGGFLFTRSLLYDADDRGAVSVPGFWARRVIRVGPQLALVLVAIGIASRYDNFDPWSADQTSRSLTSAATFTLNWGLIRDPFDYRADVGHLWYLSAEFQIYAFLVLIVGVCARYRGALTAIVGTAVVAATAWRFHVITDQGAWAAALRTTTRADGVLVGSLGALVLPHALRQADLAKRFTLAFLAALVGLVLLSPSIDPDAFLRGQGIAFVLAVATLVVSIPVARGGNPGNWLLARRPLVFVGRISYPLFLWHLPVFLAASRWAPQIDWFERALWTGAALAGIVAASYRWVELPIERLLARTRTDPDRALPGGDGTSRPVSWSWRHWRTVGLPAPTRWPRSHPAPATMSGQRTHLGALDGLRGAACVLVVLLHLFLIVPLDEIEDKSGPFFGLFRSGSLGVTIFFVVGSFLVTRGLLNESQRTGLIRVDRFWMRRLVRVGAQLYLLLVVLLVVSWFDRWDGWTHEQHQRSLLTAATFTLNWTLVDDPSGARNDVGNLWYLSVEHQFYFVWLFILAWLGRFRRTLMMLLSGSVIAVFVWRFRVIDTQTSWIAGLRTSTRADGLLLGALAACVLPTVCTWQRAGRWIAVPCLVTLGYLVYRSPTLDDYAYLKTQGIVFALVTTVLVLSIAVTNNQGPAGRILSLPPMLFIGRISFPLYLWHYPVFWGSARWAKELTWVPRAVGTCVVLAGIVLVTYRCVERPINRWMGRVREPRITDDTTTSTMSPTATGTAAKSEA